MTRMRWASPAGAAAVVTPRASGAEGGIVCGYRAAAAGIIGRAPETLTPHSRCRGGIVSLSGMSEARDDVAAFELTCPHCRKPFAGHLLAGSAARYEGFKCPHCRLFVPLARIEQPPIRSR